jgi:ABC-type antimicrobial peptide transport system permease subunit
MGDLLAVVCIPFLLITIIMYLVVFRKQFTQLDNETNRLVIIATRLALFLPFYAILIFISIVIPVIYTAMEIPLALIEGYSFYAFFVLLVTNMGGPVETVNYLTKSDKKLLFYCCCPLDKKKFYGKATWNLFHFLFTRVIVVFLSVICTYADTKISKLLAIIFSLVALVQLIYGVASVINLCESKNKQTYFIILSYFPKYYF